MKSGSHSARGWECHETFLAHFGEAAKKYHAMSGHIALTTIVLIQNF